jgi:hypothetical protein
MFHSCTTKVKVSQEEYEELAKILLFEIEVSKVVPEYIQIIFFAIQELSLIFMLKSKSPKFKTAPVIEFTYSYFTSFQLKLVVFGVISIL